MEECGILGVKTYSDPPTYFQGVKTPTPRIYAPANSSLAARSVAYTVDFVQLGKVNSSGHRKMIPIKDGPRRSEET